MPIGIYDHRPLDPEYLAKRRAARFLSKIVPEGECLIFTGKADTGTGYGVFCGELAHRFAYSQNAPIPDGMDILHTCDYRRCVRFKHLYPGTNDDNIRDRVERNRSRNGYMAGHPNAIPRGTKNGNAALSPDTVRSLRRMYKDGTIASFRQEGRRLGISHHTIRLACYGDSYRDVADKQALTAATAGED